MAHLCSQGGRRHVTFLSECRRSSSVFPPGWRAPARCGAPDVLKRNSGGCGPIVEYLPNIRMESLRLSLDRSLLLVLLAVQVRAPGGPPYPAPRQAPLPPAIFLMSDVGGPVILVAVRPVDGPVSTFGKFAIFDQWLIENAQRSIGRMSGLFWRSRGTATCPLLPEFFLEPCNDLAQAPRSGRGSWRDAP